MEKITIWHNPRCGKSRESFRFLEEKGIDAEVVKYLDTPPLVEELKEVLKMLGTAPRELMRTKEAIYKELNLKEEKDDEKLIEAMVAHPKLIERPIIIKGNKAVVGRPLENVVELLS